MNCPTQSTRFAGTPAAPRQEKCPKGRLLNRAVLARAVRLLLAALCKFQSVALLFLLAHAYTTNHLYPSPNSIFVSKELILQLTCQSIADSRFCRSRRALLVWSCLPVVLESVWGCGRHLTPSARAEFAFNYQPLRSCTGLEDVLTHRPLFLSNTWNCVDGQLQHTVFSHFQLCQKSRRL